MSYHTYSYDSKKLLVYKPEGQEITPALLARIKKECNSDYVFSIHKDTEKKLWYCSRTAVSIGYSQHLFKPNVESILVFGDSFYPNVSPSVGYRELCDGEDWFMVAGVGKMTFISNASESMKVLFENFLRFLDLKGLHKLLTRITRSCAGTAYAYASKGGAKLVGSTWGEKDGIFYSSLDFANKLSYEQKTFAVNVLAYLSGDKYKEELKRLVTLGDTALVAELKKNPELFDLVSKI